MSVAEAASRYRLWYGRDEPPAEAIPLRAGPVTAELVGRDLRNVRYGGIEVAQRVYVAIRDRNWDTVPGEIANLVVDRGEDRFAVSFDVRHRAPGVDIAWRGRIVGEPDGTIAYAMDATPAIDMTYKLVGLNVHHGMDDYAGRPYEARTTEGTVRGTFPLLVEPQLIADGTEVPIFPATEEVTVQLTDAVSARFVYEGDIFEFEDQRNWTDASFKSQSYPPRRNGVFHAAAGQPIHQAVTIVPSGPPPPPPPAPERLRVTVGPSTGQRLAPIGFGMPSHGGALSEREAALLRVLRPAHLRVDLDLTNDRALVGLARAAESCRALGCGLELALFLGDDPDPDSALASLAAALERENVPVHRVLVFRRGEQATGEPWISAAREALGAVAAGALFAGGSNANFCELNRHRPRLAPGDGVAWSINPQIHAFDERSLAENIAAQAETVVTARAVFGDRPIVVSPVTLKQRFNAVAIAAPPPLGSGELPPQVDPRQASLFAAAWTVGSVNHLSAAGVASLTYYETTGWRGAIETDAGNSVPETFPSRPGDVFPLYHVFADLAEWRDGMLLAAASDDPLAVETLAVAGADRLHLLVANLTPHEQAVRIAGLPVGEARVRVLDDASATRAMRDPAAFRAGFVPVPETEDGVELVLPPFAVARIDGGGPR